jgi:hypothetical protein|eukprot:TRINITY_DN44164_c0_g1_i1.p1 TRINITY_DN44164_c0_g1~~TRINITY_DN44164_c0_g1_i1.p1  ORF type:complete len:282 (+),score=54.45 TRINITY_DN44164_c0_g1_i1:104-949(+)
MDDDAPLSALAAKPKAPKEVAKKLTGEDAPLANLAKSASKKNLDDIPLSVLADAKKPKAAPKQGSSAPKAKAKGKAKRKDSSSSSSSSDSDSSSSDSERGKKKGRSGAKKPKLEKTKTEDDIDNKVNKRDRTLKQQVVADLLCRWWYALPDWPPPADCPEYKEELRKRGYREVRLQEWEWVPEEVDGLKKVYQLSAFAGCYRASSGDMIDVRPKETCPCYRNFMKKELPELYDLLVKALQGQLDNLKYSKYDETQLTLDLKVKLNRATEKAALAKQAGSKK